MRGTRISVILISVCSLSWSLGCDSKPKTNPFENPAAPKQPPPITAPPKPTGPPDFMITAEGPKVGWTNILIEKKEGPQKLRDEIAANKQYVNDQVVAMTVDRNAKTPWVAEMIKALSENGASAVDITTETRTEYPKKVHFTPVKSVQQPAACSVVAKVLAERRNAVWHLKGGTAVRSPKGLAGPDMAMTEENLKSAAGACKGSDVVFIGADEGVEWGLVYDLAAASQMIESAKLKKVVLLSESPTAGREVQLN